MMQQTILMHYHLPEKRSLRDRTTIERFLSEITGQGYSLATFTYPGNLAWLAQTSLSIETGGSASPPSVLSPALQNDLELFASGKNPSLWVLAFPGKQETHVNYFKCGIAFQDSLPTISLVMRLETIAFAASEEESTRVFEQWLALFQKAYTIWQPLYAHSLVFGLKWPEPALADLESGHVPYLYEINFFGPKLVEGIGKERLLSAPVWRTQRLADGGVLLVPEHIFAQRSPQVWEITRQHLDMQRALWCQYVPAPYPV